MDLDLDLDPDRLEALAAAVSEGTFEAAARKLHVTPSAISQRVKALESSLGRALVVRSKPVRPTASGTVVLRGARQIQAINADVAAELGDVAEDGGPISRVPGAAGRPVVIPIAANADSLDTWLMPALATVSAPIVFDIVRDDEGRTAEFLRQGEVMAAVTASADPAPGCTVTRLGDMWYRPKATSDFCSRWFADGVTAAALASAPVVVFDRNDHLQDGYLRRRLRREPDPPRQYVPGSHAYYEAVRLGIGWGMVPDLQDEPGGGAAVQLDPSGATAVTLHWQQWRLRTRALDLVASAVRTGAGLALG